MGWEELGQEESIAFALSSSLFCSTIGDGVGPWSYAVLGLYPSMPRAGL